MARSIQVVIYMEQELLDRIDRATTDAHDNRSEWIREACEQRLVKAEYEQLIENQKPARG